MRQTSLGVAAIALLAAACVTVSPGQPSVSLPSTVLPTVAPLPSDQPLPSISTLPSVRLLPSMPPLPSAGSLPPAPSIAPASPGATTVTVTIGSGADAQTYAVTGEPNCSYGVIDDGTWGVAWGDISAGDGQLSEVQLTDEPDESAKNARIVSAYIVVGPVFGGTAYTLSFDRFGARFVRDVEDNGDTATIHVAGKSTASMLGPGGVPVDLTVSCPTVSRA